MRAQGGLACTVPTPTQTNARPSPAPASCGEVSAKGRFLVARPIPAGDSPAIVQPLATEFGPLARKKSRFAGLTDAPINAVPLRAFDGEVRRCIAAAHEMAHRRVGQVITADATCQQPLLNFRVFAGTGHVPA